MQKKTPGKKGKEKERRAVGGEGGGGGEEGKERKLRTKREEEREEGRRVRGEAFGKEVLIWASFRRGHKNRARSQVSFHLRGSFSGMDLVHFLLYFVFGYR